MNTVTEDIEEVSEDLFFFAASPAMRKLRAQAELLAKVNVPVLILGENGSGKEIAARLIHKLSVRSASRFLKVNCAALPGDVLESEIFGCERGAFPSSRSTRQGKLELCHNGTILLDEIAEMPTALQAKLLHVLQDNQMFRLGGDTTISVDVRILAATSPKVEQALLEKKLREDVYYRLSAFTLHVPPLRDRREEIPLLLAHFIKQLAKRYGLKPRPVSAVLLNGCHTYSWPGNLRELENVAKRYLVMGDDFLELGELGVRPISHADENSSSSVDSEGATPVSGHGEHRDAAHLKNLVRSIKGETERNVIASTLEKTQWNRKAAARDLGISYRGLLYKIQEYHLIPPGHYVPSVPKTMHGSVTDRNTDLRRS